MFDRSQLMLSRFSGAYVQFLEYLPGLGRDDFSLKILCKLDSYRSLSYGCWAHHSNYPFVIHVTIYIAGFSYLLP